MFSISKVVARFNFRTSFFDLGIEEGVYLLIFFGFDSPQLPQRLGSELGCRRLRFVLAGQISPTVHGSMRVLR